MTNQDHINEAIKDAIETNASVENIKMMLLGSIATSLAIIADELIERRCKNEKNDCV